MNRSLSRASALCVLAALPLLSCIAGPLPLRQPRTCLESVYTPTGDTIPLNFQVDARASRSFELMGYCLVLDGASLTMRDAAGGPVAYSASKVQRLVADISRSGPHELVFTAWMRGLGELEGERFDIETGYEFVLTGAAAPTIGLVLSDRPGVSRLERRPTVEWQPNAGIARQPRIGGSVAPKIIPPSLRP